METEKLDGYQFIRLLGQGAFASVYLAKSTKTGQQVAIKKVLLKQSRDKDKQCALTEVRLLASVCHENIIGFRDAFFHEKHEILYVVMEFAQKGDLSKRIEYLRSKKRYVPEEEIWKFIRQIANALKVLHDNNIIHRDLKSANIFITEEGNYKVADFNVAKLVKNYNGLAQTKVGTPLYTSPQVWDNDGYDVKSDIWSLGVIVYQFASLELPFPANSFPQLYQKISRGKPKRVPNCYSDDLERVISSMLHKNASKRPSADQLIQYSIPNDVRVPSRRKLKSRLSLIDTIHNPTELSNLKLSSKRLKTDNQRSICQKEPHHPNSVLVQNSYKCKNNQNQNSYDSPIITVRDRIKSQYRSRILSQKPPIISLKSSNHNTNQNSNTNSNSVHQIKKQHIALKPIVLNFQIPPKPPMPPPLPATTQRTQPSQKQSKKILRLPSLSMHRS